MNEDIKCFLNSAKWIFAKTYAKSWPHEYTLLKDSEDKNIFIDFVRLINTEGYLGKFYDRDQVYFEYENMIYWTMDETIETTDLINRVHKNMSYEYRLKNNMLPERGLS